MLKISKVTFRKILRAAADKEIVELAREVAQNSSRTIILARYGTLSLTSILDYLNNLVGYAYFAREKRVITLIHSYGEKGSIFVKAYAKALFEMINIDLKISSTENSVNLSSPNKSRW